jgi:hypothetical protein
MPKTTDAERKRALLGRLPKIREGNARLPHHLAKRKAAAEEKQGALRTAQDLMDRLGTKAEPILYALLCDDKHPLRKSVDAALRNGSQSAIAVLVPLLIAQFALAPALAVVVAGFVVKTLASKGQKKLCEELAAKRARPHPQPKKTRTLKPRAKRRTAKPAVEE